MKALIDNKNNYDNKTVLLPTMHSYKTNATVGRTVGLFPMPTSIKLCMVCLDNFGMIKLFVNNHDMLREMCIIFVSVTVSIVNDGIVTIYECMWAVSTSAFSSPDCCAAGLVNSPSLRLDWSLDEQRVADNATTVAS